MKLTILNERKSVVWKATFFPKQELITRARLRVQYFVTGENVSFNERHNKKFSVFFFLGKVNL